MSAPRQSHPLAPWLAPAAFGAALAAVGLVALRDASPPPRAADPTLFTPCEGPLPRCQPSGEAATAGPTPSKTGPSAQSTPKPATLASPDAGKAHIDVGPDTPAQAAPIIQSRAPIPEKSAPRLVSHAPQDAARPAVLIRRNPASYGAPYHAAPAASSSQSLATPDSSRRKMWLCPPMEPRPINPRPRATPVPQTRTPPRPPKRAGPAQRPSAG
jgi:hypothetical protein